MNTSTVLLLGGGAVAAYLLYESLKNSDYAGNVVTGIQQIVPVNTTVSTVANANVPVPLNGAENIDLASGLLQIAQNALVNTSDGNGGQFSKQNGLILATAKTWDFYAGMLGYNSVSQFTSTDGWGLCTIDYYMNTIRQHIPANYRNNLAATNGMSGLNGFGLMYHPQWRKTSTLELINQFGR